VDGKMKRRSVDRWLRKKVDGWYEETANDYGAGMEGG
jgi:hypothetical protein